MTYFHHDEPIEGGALERLPIIGRFGGRCDHRWGEPVIMRRASTRDAARVMWSCLECGKCSESGRAA